MSRTIYEIFNKVLLTIPLNNSWLSHINYEIILLIYEDY